MDRTGRAVRLLAGALIFDVLIDIPAFSVSAPVASLLAPSLDLLVVLALLLGVSTAAPRLRRGFAIAVSVFAAALLAWKAVDRFGPAHMISSLMNAPVPARAALVAAGAAAVAAAGAVAYLSSSLVLRGFEERLLRNVFLAAAAACAVTQALTGARVFSQSEIPRIIREVFH